MKTLNLIEQPASPCGVQRQRARGARAAEVFVSALAAAALLSLFAMAPGVLAATYKWVDDKGVVHYTDKIPTEAVNKGSTVLDKQARPVKRIEPALTPEQIRARENEAEQKRLMSRVNEETARRDRALVSSYTNENEIELARSRALGTLDAQITSSKAYVTQLTQRKVDLDKRQAALAGKPLPAALEREIEGTASELEKTVTLIEQKRKEREAVVARYEADRIRWRELKAVTDASAEAAASTPITHPALAPAASRK